MSTNDRHVLPEIRRVLARHVWEICFKFINFYSFEASLDANLKSGIISENKHKIGINQPRLYEKIGLLKKKFSWEESIFSYNQWNLDLNACKNAYSNIKHYKQMEKCFQIISMDIFLLIDTILGGISMFYLGFFYILLAGILKKKFDQYFNFTIISCVLLRPKMKIRILTFFLSPEPKGSFISEAQSDWSLAFGKMLLTNELANTKKGSTLIPFTDSQSDWSLAFGKSYWPMKSR